MARYAIHSMASAASLAVALIGPSGCGGDGGGSAPSNAPPLTATPTPSPTPTPTPSASNPPATNLLPPAPFGLITSTDFSLVGWQDTSQTGAPPLVAAAEHNGTLAWSANLKTYTIALTDLGSGRLVYTFPPSGNNLLAFSVVKADGSIAKVHVTLVVKSANVGEIYWSTAQGVTPSVLAHALVGIPIVGSLPTTGRRVFPTDTNPQSSIIIDFVTRKVSGTVTAFDHGADWGLAGPKEQATIEPADIQPDGSFVAAITIPDAPKKGELRGRLFGPAGTELGVYWNAPVRNGFDKAFGEWRDLKIFPVCSSCSE